MSSARQIWKFALPYPQDEQFSIDTPGPTKVVHMTLSDIWLEVQPGWPVAPHFFRWFGTGHNIPDEPEHVGTVIDSPFVWHLYKYGHGQ